MAKSNGEIVDLLCRLVFVMTTDKLIEIYNLLSERFGPQHWWPGETRFEVIIGAILTQNTSWSNVEKAFTSLSRMVLSKALTKAKKETSFTI